MKIIFISLICSLVFMPNINNAISMDEVLVETQSNPEFDEQIDLGTLLSLVPLVIDAIPGIDLSDLTSIIPSTLEVIPSFLNKLFGRDGNPESPNVLINELNDVGVRVDKLSFQITNMDNKVSLILENSDLILNNTRRILSQISASERNIINRFDEVAARAYRTQIRTTIDLIRADPTNAVQIWELRKQDFNTSMNYLFTYEINVTELSELFGYTIFYLTMEDPRNLDRNFSSPTKDFIKNGFNDFLNRISESYENRDVQFNHAFGIAAQYIGIGWRSGLFINDPTRKLEFFDDGRKASLRAITYNKQLTFSNRSLYVPWAVGFEPGKNPQREEEERYQFIYNVLRNTSNLRELSISRDHYYTLLQAGIRYKWTLGL